MSEKMEENLGIKFDNARLIVNKTLQETLNSYQANRLTSYKLILFVLIPPIICTGIYIIILSLREQDTGYHPSLIVVSIILLFIGILNSLLLIRINKSEALEVINEIKDIASEYENSISEFPTCTPENIDPELNNDPTIVSGHTHVNIVTTYRNTRWQRLPVLLLAEGDIIALMAGDVTPGKVHELIPLSQKSFGCYFSSGRNNNDSDSDKHFKIGPLIEKGKTIYLRNKSPPQPQPRGSGSGQGSGGDLYTLNEDEPSQDQSQYPPLASSPIDSTISSGQSSSDHLSFQDNIGISTSNFSKNKSIPPESTELLSLSGDIRCFKLAETPIKSFCESLLDNNNNNDDENINQTNNSIKKKNISTRNSSSLFPIFGKRPPQVIGECGDESAVRLLFFFIVRKGIKIMIIFIILSIIFSLVRLSIISTTTTSQYIEEIIVPIGTIIICFIPISLPICMVLAESIATANLLATTEVILQSETEKQNLENLSKQEAINKAENEVDRVNITGGIIIDDDDDSDEFLDDDIDERAEEIADEAYTKMKYLRIFQYFINVIRCRLLLNGEENKNYSNTEVSKSRGFLPIPLGCIRLHEMLGAVTMVCFVDDDIICEGYSVTEEIFLLTGNNEKDDAIKGTVLDLHANPEATGSRFENPMWWKYLPSLKPVGLAALLTYSPTPPPAIQAAKTSNKTINENNNAKSNNESQRDKIIKKNNQKNNKANLNKRKANTIEVELISHIRKSIPLEALRELAEEIGFAEDDVKVFNRMLEMNVIAPDLGDTRVLEDTHSWGQEETRRRGILHYIQF
jgi:hypothetical protein